MNPTFHSGYGHFGDQTGDAGQRKGFITMATLHDHTDWLWSALCGQSIYVEVVGYSMNARRKVGEARLFGTDVQIAAATKFLATMNPPIMVVRADAPKDAF